MPRFRSLKNDIRSWLRRGDWSTEQPLPPEMSPRLPAAERAIDPVSLVGPLFACLPEGGLITERSSYALGSVLAVLAEESPEEARNVIRRFMWHMNEESGNIGWGIPEAFAEALAQSRKLADGYYRVLFSYIHDREGDNTWCDYAPLRISCYRAVERVMAAHPDLQHEALCLLKKAEVDPDPTCRAMALELFERYKPAPGVMAGQTLSHI